jgi:hypothetical protein
MSHETPGQRATTRQAGTNPKYAGAKRLDGGADDDTPESERPADTGTPGGMLGTASQRELSEDPEAASSKMDERLSTDER